MDNLRDRTESQRNIIEKILHKIPGFKGYLEKEYRRETDHVFRQFLVQRLAEGKKRLNDAVRAVTDAGKISMLQPVTEISNKLEKVESRIRFASHGYSGFFDVVKVREAELDALYQFDLGLLDRVEDLVGQLSSLEGAVDEDADFKQAVRDCRDMVRDMDSLLDERQNTLTGLGGGAL
jgi:hypothetical protein